MRVACLVSGGKDSIFAAHAAQSWGWTVTEFLTLLPDAQAPMLFHRPNAKWVELQARAAGVKWKMEAIAEGADEEDALRRLLRRAEADAVVAGALASEFQRTRFERAALGCGLKSFTPLWHHDPLQHLRDTLAVGIRARFAHVAADGLDHTWLGRHLDAAAVDDLSRLSKTKRLNPAGEGGEYETFVEDAPLFREAIEVTKAHLERGRDDGTWVIDDARLVSKPT